MENLENRYECDIPENNRKGSDNENSSWLPDFIIGDTIEQVNTLRRELDSLWCDNENLQNDNKRITRENERLMIENQDFRNQLNAIENLLKEMWMGNSNLSTLAILQEKIDSLNSQFIGLSLESGENFTVFDERIREIETELSNRRKESIDGVFDILNEMHDYLINREEKNSENISNINSRINSIISNLNKICSTQFEIIDEDLPVVVDNSAANYWGEGKLCKPMEEIVLEEWENIENTRKELMSFWLNLLESSDDKTFVGLWERMEIWAGELWSIYKYYYDSMSPQKFNEYQGRYRDIKRKQWK